ncbi:hypothetical protein [Altererythrobacter sp. MTPC7]|uniref:hypothetical protein n=1 Tax=Altererythrobacter sp. MTPC7 TaxID=3056567 RepID=UPI0036F2083D
MTKTKNNPKNYRARDVAAHVSSRGAGATRDRGTTFFNGPVKNGFLILRKPKTQDNAS